MEIKVRLTENGKHKAEAYIAELKAKRKEILDAGLDSADDTDIPTVSDIEGDITWDCTGIDYEEYANSWGVTDNYDSDSPICLVQGEDFTLYPKLSDFFKWTFLDSEGYIAVEGYGIYQYEMSLSPDLGDDECMRVKIGERNYYFG